MSKHYPFFASFRHAFRGLGVATRGRNFRVMLAAAVAVVALGVAYDIATHDWVVLVLCIGGVLSAEAANTAVELLADIVQAQWHPGIRDVKDIAAGAVLLFSILAAVVGVLVFWPYVAG